MACAMRNAQCHSPTYITFEGFAMSQFLQVERDGHVLIATMNQPETR